MEFETIIGLELHAQVMTRSKMFCACSSEYADAVPNTHVCPVCLGMPGVLPVTNREAVAKTIMTGLALNCSIPGYNKFDRKNYMYPDLPKGYQISQYDLPIAVNGYIDLIVDGSTRRVGITRVHLEEDTARLTHREDASGEYSLIDFNRSGTPLMEIVGEPDLRSPREAREFLVAIRRILRYICASTGNMEEGAFRCDANISQRSVDGSVVGAKVEVKNMNSFRSVERALEYEVERQRAVLRAGQTIVQETRGWVEDRGVTVGQRTKEYAHDYRYFPEPDLPPVMIAESWVAELRAGMPELPLARRERFVSAFGLEPDEADLIVDDAAVADYYERAVAAAGGLCREVANWLVGEVFAVARSEGGFDKVGLPPEYLAEVVSMVQRGEVNALTGKEVLTLSRQEGVSPRQIVTERGLMQATDEDAMRAVVAAVLAANEPAVSDYRKGKKAAIGFLLGQAMREMKGRGNPDALRRLLIHELERDN